MISIIAGGPRVETMAKVPLSFPTYAGMLARAAYRAAQQIYPEFRGQDALVQKSRASNTTVVVTESDPALPQVYLLMLVTPVQLARCHKPR
jgi:hypothetical protein